MLRIILFTLFLLLVPQNLVRGYTDFYVEKWPCVIMETGDYQYVMDAPGAQIRVVEISRAAQQRL